MFHSLKYHAALSSVAFVHSLPRKWAILPTPMHVVDASKHTSHILCQYLRCVFFIWFPQIEFPKHRHHRSGKPGNAFKKCRPNQTQIVICTICRSPIGKTPQGSRVIVYVLALPLRRTSNTRRLHPSLYMKKRQEARAISCFRPWL
jgi:hypothetical protein